MQGATKANPLALKQQQFEEKHEDIILEIGNRFGDALYRQDVDEIMRLSACLNLMVTHVSEKLRELDSQPIS